MPARDVLDRAELEEKRKDFVIGVHDKRGIISRSPRDGGDQEWHLAAHYRGLAEKVQSTHPDAAGTLEKFAKSHESEGRREDVDAALRKEGY